MDATMLRGLVTVESNRSQPSSGPIEIPMPSEPERARPSSKRPSFVHAPEPIELRELPPETPVPCASPAETVASNDLEMSRPASPIVPADGVEALQSLSNPPMNRFRFASSCLISLGTGLNDSAPGALIPYMELYYHIGYGIVSLLFVGNAIGFIVGACFLDTIRERTGRAKTIALGQILVASGYVILVCTPPFELVVIALFLIGFGASLNLAVNNVFCGSLRNGTTVLGVLHGCYGVGGTVGPLIATTMTASAGILWSRFYFITLGLALVNIVFASWAFWKYDQELSAQDSGEPTGGVVPGQQQQSSAVRRSTLVNTMSSLSSRVVLLGALFIFAYQGAEVSISGWVISFLIASRNGDPSRVGYVTAGFWGGITLGRFLLSAPAQRVGERRFVYGLVIGAAIFELLVWLVPNVVGDAVAVAIVGLLLGPVYPCAAAVFLRSMSRWEQTSGLGVISAFGSSGGAVAPFTTGMLAQTVGTFVLHPIAIALFGAMMGCWYGIPNRPKRTE